MQLAKKGKRRRPKGRMLMGIRREWMEKGSKIEGGREGIMVDRRGEKRRRGVGGQRIRKGMGRVNS